MLQSTRKHEAGCAGANLNLPPECDAELGPPRGQNPPGPASSRRPRPERLLGRPWLGCPGDSARPGLPGHACHRGTITVCSAHRRPCLADGGPGRGTRPLTPPPPSEGPAQRGRRWVSGGAGGACAGGRRRRARGPAGPPPATGPRGEAAGAWPPPTGAAGRRPGRSPAQRPLRPRPPARLLGRSRRRLLVLGGLNHPPCGTRPVPGAGPLAPAAGLSGSRLGDEGPAGRPSPALLRHTPAARLRPQRGGQKGARRGRTGVPPRARSVCGLRRRRCLYDGDRDPSRG